MSRIVLRSYVKIAEISTGCRFNDWEWVYRPWMPLWFQKRLIVRPLWKRHKRNCIRAEHWRAMD
ncbi:hypothetical protein SEA_ILEEKAY_3 [Mycobacterium phage ILeeKay]|nr:hypothetical protein SEA_ILEEKAY_3 [Mycobacterium phage ILeeKay]QAY03699.1 hypothetical protein SEA_PETP2012_3 [Mycobacterium phage Petp2012]QGH80191.1 hypothetical protein SEA_KYMONKS1A_3 [Mycobacterium phage KyMonks1A]